MKNICQSCSMPLSQDKKGGGTEKDGSTSTKYCSLCYEKGKFKDDFTTAKQMQDFCVNIMHKNGMPKWLAWILTRSIPSLERWKK